MKEPRPPDGGPRGQSAGPAAGVWRGGERPRRAASRGRGEVATSVDDEPEGRKMGGRGLEAQSGGGSSRGCASEGRRGGRDREG